MAALASPTSDGQSLSVDRPRALFQTRLIAGGSAGPNFKIDYDVASDGERFLMLQGSESSDALAITVVANWHPKRP